MAQIKYLLPQVDRYFKTQLHTHSNISDGAPSPEEMKDLYKARGFQILAVTDHNLIADHSRLNDEDFLMLTGAEYNINEDNDNGNRHWIQCKTYHMNFIAKRPDNLWQPFGPPRANERTQGYWEKTNIVNMEHVYSLECINEMIAEANRQGFLVSYNHPSWSLQDYTDYAGLKGLWGMEIANYDSSLHGSGDSNNSRVYNDLLNQGNRLFPLGGDDAHNAGCIGGAWIMVGAQKLEYGSVIDALEKGDFYATTGPEIDHLSYCDGKLTIRCSDAQAITLEAGNRYFKAIMPKKNDKLVRGGTIDISKWFELCDGTSPRDWFRITVRGAYGQYAATRAFFRDEF